MTKEELIARNKRFAIEVLFLTKSLPNDRIYDALARQLVRCATSIGANYRAACRAKSPADFINKLKITEEEADESNYFLDILLSLANGSSNKEKLVLLVKESDELTAIFAASIITMRKKMQLKS